MDTIPGMTCRSRGRESRLTGSHLNGHVIPEESGIHAVHPIGLTVHCIPAPACAGQAFTGTTMDIVTYRF